MTIEISLEEQNRGPEAKLRDKLESFQRDLLDSADRKRRFQESAVYNRQTYFFLFLEITGNNFQQRAGLDIDSWVSLYRSSVIIGRQMRDTLDFTCFTTNRSLTLDFFLPEYNCHNWFAQAHSFRYDVMHTIRTLKIQHFSGPESPSMESKLLRWPGKYPGLCHCLTGSHCRYHLNRSNFQLLSIVTDSITWLDEVTINYFIDDLPVEITYEYTVDPNEPVISCYRQCYELTLKLSRLVDRFNNRTGPGRVPADDNPDKQPYLNRTQCCFSVKILCGHVLKFDVASFADVGSDAMATIYEAFVRKSCTLCTMTKQWEINVAL